MYILFGLLSTIVIVLADRILSTLFGTELHSISILFIIPVIALIEGAGCGAGIFIYLKARNILVKPQHYLTAALIGVIGFIGIYYATYISYYSKYNITFMDYIQVTLSTAESTFSFKGKTLGEFSNKAFNQFNFILEGLAFMIGSTSIGSFIIGKLTYCKNCKKYYKEKKLYTFTVSDAQKEIEELNNCIEQNGDIKELVNRNREMPEKPEPRIDVYLSYCPVCSEGSIVFKYMAVSSVSNNRASFIEDDSKRKAFGLSAEKVNLFI